MHQRQIDRRPEPTSKMSAGLAKKAIQVKYKKISFKDLEFDQGDDVSIGYWVSLCGMKVSPSPSIPMIPLSVFRERTVW